MRKTLLFFTVPVLLLIACGSSPKPPTKSGSEADEPQPTAEEVASATKPCGEKDKVHVHDLHSEGATEAFAPCSGSGAGDYSGLIKIETVENGVHIIIDARDDQVTLLGPDVKSRDAVIVYPKGKGAKAIEVPLTKTKTGYHGDKIVFWDDLEKLNDEGTQIDVAIFDHDKNSGQQSEEMHVSVQVSTGMSCEKAWDKYAKQEMNMTKGGGGTGGGDLNETQLGAPFKGGGVVTGCGLPDSSKADICAVVQKGKVLGVTVGVTPQNNKIAACIDRRTRGLGFPQGPNAQRVIQKF